ncbi:MAG: hypothetical protein AB7L09_15310 [Nitrospira sp.]
MGQAVLQSLAVSCMLISTVPAAAERSWELSIGGYGGWAFHGDTTFQANQLINVSTGFVEPVDGKGTNLRFEDAGTLGAKLSAWHLPRKYRWQPQIGLEIDWTRFIADVPGGQVIPGFGTFLTSGTPLGLIGPISRREFAVDNIAFNLLFGIRSGPQTICRRVGGIPMSVSEEVPNGLAYLYRAMKRPAIPLPFGHWQASSSL